jgi:hypothetical protein
LISKILLIINKKLIIEDEINMPLMQGWEVSPDRVESYEKMMGMDPIGDPIITTKCRLDSENGMIIVSDNGFAWRIKITFARGAAISAGKSKWVRWYDVSDLMPKKDGVIIAFLKVRDKNGALKPGKIKKWKLMILPNKGEDKVTAAEKKAAFNNIMLEIFQRNKVDTDPPTSDSRI